MRSKTHKMVTTSDRPINLSLLDLEVLHFPTLRLILCQKRALYILIANLSRPWRTRNAKDCAFNTTQRLSTLHLYTLKATSD